MDDARDAVSPGLVAVQMRGAMLCRGCKHLLTVSSMILISAASCEQRKGVHSAVVSREC